MRLTRVFVDEPLASGAEMPLGAVAAGHVVRVLRLKSGDALTLFDGRGGEYAGTVADIRRGAVRVQVGPHDPVERESPLAITLAQGAARGERMDWVVQKATELGVRTIVPLLTERSVLKLDAKQSSAKRAHWRAVAVSACEQCGRNRVPSLAPPTDLRDWLASLKDSDTRLVLEATAQRSLGLAPTATALTLLIGPEGGLSDAERQAARSVGFDARRLGPRILRTETAAVTALSILQAAAGDLAQ